MAAYLIHGFKWPRAAIRIHVIINNIDDAAPDWTMSSSSCQAFKDNLETLFPDTMAALADFRLIEQYNTIDENCQPHAFVADFVKEIPFSLDVDQVRLNHSFTPQAWEAMCDLRDHLSVDEKIHWYIVFNCDPERDMGPDLPPKDDDDNWGGGSKGREQESDKKRGMGGFKKLFGGGSSKGSVKGSATS